MLTALREAARERLAQIPVQRKPALRRTDNPDALLACDLPGVAAPEEVQAFTADMENAGWRIQQEDGWLLMDHDVPEPAWAWPDAYPGEWGCCLWLLRRYPGKDAPAEKVRALVKAAEMGPGRVEWLCARWHGEFAALLREHQPLPGGLAPYLCAAMKEEKR